MTDSVFISTDKVPARKGAEILLEILASEGVEYIFGNPGTTELPLMDALVGKTDISYILALQEASAVAMADGYAQAARKPGFLNLHTAGGLGHGMGNLLNAKISHTPLVVTAGQQDLRHAITDPLLFGDLVQLAQPAVKWAQEVSHPSQLPVLLRRAFHDVVAPPPGPVMLSLPMNVMEEMSDTPLLSRSVIDTHSVASSLESLAEELARIQPGRLAIIAGDELYSSQAAPQAVKLAELLGAPVYGSSWPSRIPFPTSHPLWAGNLPTKAAAIADELSNYDAIFALGGKSLISILYTSSSAVPDNCAVYQLSSDVGDLGRTYPTRLSLVGHLRASLDALLPILAGLTQPTRADRNANSDVLRVQRDANRKTLYAQAEDDYTSGVISPLVAAREVMRVIGHDIAIVDEAIVTSSAVRQFLNSPSYEQYSFLRGGALGWGMPAAVGCSLGLGRAPVVSLVGDGAALYSPQSLWTAAHENLPVTFIVMNNRQYNVLKNFMRSQQHYLAAQTERFIAMDLVNPEIDYQALARSMGVTARRITRAADIAPAVEAGIHSGQANLIEIVLA
ncbi:thiamine pyrophosphate-binding protein [Brenneria goodwinii]|uniref:Benzoylformate decarboxylase n=1 Tax=Brenneria goodwinii TaxID=1109412 RepID=A0A0G4K1U3_9GAMM|nr:thiamine pyrophosphate-binding protein [Brenneria goodwinii]CPR21028.1 Benzoylformate decarboxylase [Brenneria goodwinii]